jgi:hypothetical protein
MTKTQIQKVFAAIALFAIATTNFGAAYATQVGTGSVTGTGAFDSVINWDDSFPGTASGSVSNILIKARVNPSLNMQISAEEIDLGVLVAGVTSTGGLFIEVGTNAVSGVSITARSQNAGLENTSDGTIEINDLSTDGIAESYTWESTAGATDSSNGAFISSGDLSTIEINDDTTEHTVYSTNKSEPSAALNDVEFVVSAESTAETPAGDYEDLVTFTVTGNF